MNDREEQELEERIRRRAYELWEAEGKPNGRADDHWDQAAELVAIEDNQKLTTIPLIESTMLGPTGEPVEPVEAIENAGEFPTLTDQGEQQAPKRKAETAAAQKKAGSAAAPSRARAPAGRRSSR